MFNPGVGETVVCTVYEIHSEMGHQYTDEIKKLGKVIRKSKDSLGFAHYLIEFEDETRKWIYPSKLEYLP